MSELRIVKRLKNNQDGELDVEAIEFMELHKGDLFTLTDPDGTPVTFKGNTIFEALDEPFVNSIGVPEIWMKDYVPVILH